MRKQGALHLNARAAAWMLTIATHHGGHILVAPGITLVNGPVLAQMFSVKDWCHLYGIGEERPIDHNITSKSLKSYSSVLNVAHKRFQVTL